MGTWGIRAGSDPPTWSYRVDTFGASDQRPRVVGAPGVVHARINVDSVRPWLGGAPVQIAASTTAAATAAGGSAKGKADFRPT